MPHRQLRAFHSRALAGPAAQADGTASGGNRFSQILLGRVPLPIPQDYVRGIDLQKADFENGKPSYLLGQWRNRGWYYYYLVGLAIKVPIGVIGLIVLVLATRGCSRDRSHSSLLSARASPPPEAHQVRTGELVLLSHAFAVVLFVSLQNGFSCHFRYVVPAFPFVFVWVSQVGSRISGQYPLQSRLALGCLVASVCSSLANYPHSMSYFNGIAGGPLNGHQYMLDSSHSWKQDIFYLKHWLDAHLPGELPFVSVAARIPADDFGIRHRGPSPAYRGNAASHHPEQEGPVPGWHAIDLQWIWDRKQEHRYFLTFEPVAKVGYSIYVYHLTLEDANRARRSLGLSELEAPKISVERFADRMRERVHRQVVPRVAVYTQPAVDGSLSEIPPELVACLPDGDLKSVDAAAIAAGELAHFDVVIVGGGKAHEQAAELGPSGLQKLREFVHNGGGYVGICAGAFLGSSTFEWSLGLVNVESNTGTHYVPRFGYQMWLDRGFGDVEAVLSDQGRRLFANEQSPFPLRFSGGPILRPGRQTHLGQFVTLAEYTTEVSRFEFQQGTMRGTPAIVAAPYGDGTAVLLSSHAELLPAHRGLVTMSIKVAAR